MTSESQPSTPPVDDTAQASVSQSGDPQPAEATPANQVADQAAAEQTTAVQVPTGPSPSESHEPASAPQGKETEDASTASAVGSGLARGAGPLAARGLGVAKPASPTVSTEQIEKADKKSGKPKKKKAPRPRLGGERDATSQSEAASEKPSVPKPGKVAVPSLREGLSDDLEAELEAELAAANVEDILSGSAGMPDRKEPLSDGTRINGQVLKIHQESVYIALGGPDEGVVPFEQFEQEPTLGQPVDVVVRGFNRADGLYACSLPGSTIDVADWNDLEEGSVVEAVVTGHNTGGLECKVGGVRGFMPISQIAEYRVEDASEFVDQKLVCLVTEANERRGNLVLSHRAILERERESKKKEQLEKIEAGDNLEGTVRSVKDFGAFVDLGALDGLIHITKLSWERVKHPSEVLEVGQKVKVKIDSVDKETGKIGLSYRDLLDNPWDSAEADFAIGSLHTGTVSRIASFGCFVRLAAGVEGLVHVSELAHHRVSKIEAFVSEGQDVEVKVLSFDRDSQKIGLSMKAAKKVAEDDGKTRKEEPVDEPLREPLVKPSHQGPLKGGNDRDTGGERFGLRW